MRADGENVAAAASPGKPPRRSGAARIFGYDMFISFALGPLPRGTQSYASDLARRLREGARFIIVKPREGTLVWDTQDEAVRDNMSVEAETAAFGSHDPMFLVIETDRIGLSRVRVLSFSKLGSTLAGAEVAANEQVLWLGVRGDQIDLLISAAGAIRLESWAFRTDRRTITTTQPQAGPWALSKDGRRFAIATGGKVVVGSLGANSPTIEIHQTAEPKIVALSSDGNYLATAADNGMQVWRLEPRERWQSPPLPGRPTAIKVSRDGTFGMAAVVGSEETRAGLRHTLVRWRLANAADIQSINLGGRDAQHPLTSLCFVSDDGRFMRLSGERREIVPGDAKLASNTADDTECEVVVTTQLRLAAENSRLVVSDARSRQQLAQLDHEATILLSAAGAEGKHVATVTEHGVKVFTLDAAELIAQACARAPRVLADNEWSRYLGAATQDACGRARKGAAQ